MWVADLLIRDALKASGVASSGAVTATTITDGLHALKNDAFDGWALPLTYGPTKATAVDCWFPAKVINGQQIALNNYKPTCRS